MVRREEREVIFFGELLEDGFVCVPAVENRGGGLCGAYPQQGGAVLQQPFDDGGVGGISCQGNSPKK